MGCWINSNFHGLVGYSDDNWVLAPSIYGLQEMMNVIENFCIPHNLKFSTDPDPKNVRQSVWLSCSDSALCPMCSYAAIVFRG